MARKSTKSIKLPEPVHARLVDAARDLRIDPVRFIELAMRTDKVRLLVHAELVAQVQAEYAAARRKASAASSKSTSSESSAAS